MNEKTFFLPDNYDIRKIPAICVIMLIASFLGYLTETVWVALRHGFIDNRGMHMPFLLGYGIANLIIFLALGGPQSPGLTLHGGHTTDNEYYRFVFYCTEVFVLISVCEAALGYAVQFLCGIEWWNYTSLPFHIGKYTSIPTSTGFTLFIYLFQRHVFVPLTDYFVSVNLSGYTYLIVPVMILAVADCVYALLYMFRNGHTYSSFQIELRKKRDNPIQNT